MLPPTTTADTPPIVSARLPKEAIPRTFSWIAPLHDTLALLVESKARRLGLAWTHINDGDRVLEVAVGTGLSLRSLLRANPNGWTDGIDLSPAMLKRAQRVATRSGSNRYNLALGDAYALDFADASFDLVLNSYMFDLMPVVDFVPVLCEFRRVLKPGGKLVMMNMTHGQRWYNHLWAGLYRLHPPLLGGCRNVAVAPALRTAGFEHVRRAYVSQWTFPSEVIFGMKCSTESGKGL